MASRGATKEARPVFTERAVGTLMVMSAALLMAAFVLWRTQDPVRAAGVVYVAGLAVFALHEAHDAWREP